MCGIAGVVDSRLSPQVRAEAVGRMCAAMFHRGPDDHGIESPGAATIGMRRLAIFDPANGHQPWLSPDRRFTLVFNGAIYNFHALRDQLAAGGWVFKTQCDTEVLLAAYATWGEQCLGRLRGMFAFAVWDAQEDSLFLARDPFGIKPLYYRAENGQLVFASELNAIAASGIVSPEIDPLSVADYLAWFAVPAPRTIYHDIFSLCPGECATFRHGRLNIRSAWSYHTVAPAAPCASREEFSRELRARLDDSIRAHVVADVPVGAFLSGGLDSAVVVGLMTKVTGARLRTFSIGFDEAGYSEADAAAETAKHFGTDHHASILTGAEVARDVESLLATCDQPTGDGINTYYVSRAARAGGVTVALSGLGGDELFGGYPSFRDLPRLARWLPRWRKLPGRLRGNIINRLYRGDTRSRKLADFLRYAHNINELGALQRRVFAEPNRRALLGRAALLALGNREPFHPEVGTLAADLRGAGDFEIVSAWELRTYMADVLLRDSDVMSMRHSLELRVPFVDRPLIEWLWRQPAAFKTDPQHAKTPLSSATADILPPGLAERRKRGFTLPFALWMKRELRPFLDETFSDSSVDRSGLFSREAVQELWRGYNPEVDTREWSRLWSLAVLIAFVNRRTEPAALPPAPVPVEIARKRAPSGEILTQPAPDRGPERAVTSRTLLLAPEIFASEGGIPRMLQAYLKALCDDAGPNRGVRLLALNDSAIDSTDLRRCANNSLEDWFVCSRDKAKFVRAAVRMARECDQLVCGHVAQLPVAWLAQRFNPKLRYYLVAHGIEVWRPFSFPERKALRGAEKILCVSDYTRVELLKNCPLPEGRAVVLHNALDPWFKVEAGRPLASCPPVILCVTRLAYADRYKGVQHLVEAMPAIRAAIPEARLRIIGRGDDLARLQSLRNQLGMIDAIDFLGYVDDKRLDAELRSCRLFALPSRKEGFGLVFLEAMAHGRPCLGARAGGVPEVISPDAGVLVDYGDIPGIAQTAVDALRRNWDEDAILARARHFSYPSFKARLGLLLTPSTA